VLLQKGETRNRNEIHFSKKDKLDKNYQTILVLAGFLLMISAIYAVEVRGKTHGKNTTY